MTDARDASGAPLPDAARLTRFGRILRAPAWTNCPSCGTCSHGDMSLVGPRPLLPEYLPLYSPSRPTPRGSAGITGWAQVNGRNAITWPEVFNLDVWYVDNMNPLRDLTLRARTGGAVFSRRGVSEPGAATRSPFTGNP
jgi:lipopolysaccharide/colanic/teichoic acid biosynthesis glycosyltransferase